MKSKDRRFMLKNAENNAQTEGIEDYMKNNSKKSLMHQNFAPTLPGAWVQGEKQLLLKK